VDMRQLLAGVGMKPAEVDRIMATAVENAKKNLGAPSGGSLLTAASADQSGAPAEGRRRRTTRVKVAGGVEAAADAGKARLQGTARKCRI